ncbi:P-loop containing nucleoside triphosphate hydrolase protein [Chiua virens]|nr:P-loop containing nucleoside triphosphate hydrolase protein [Chiua virens]
MSVTIPQNLFLNDDSIITVVKCGDDAVSAQLLQPLLDTADAVLGVAATYGENCQLSSIAFSTLSQTLVVNLVPRRGPQSRRVAASKTLIQDRLFLNPKLQKYAFKMDMLAVALFLDLSIRISGGVDMLSVTTTDSRESPQAMMNAMGGELKLNKKNVKSLFFDTASLVDATSKVALEAWAACRAATLPDMASRFESLARINTEAFSRAHLVALANISRHADRLDALKPTVVKNDVNDDQLSARKGTINLQCKRFPTRIKPSANQVIQIEIQGKGTTSKVEGRARRVDGRNAHIEVKGSVRGGKILHVTTIGKDNPTCAESSRQEIILQTLQNRTKILTYPFFRALWLPQELVWPKFNGQIAALSVEFPDPLNDTQRTAVKRMLSDKDDDRIVMIHGPPGTGKTTVIAASVMSHYSAGSSQNIWIAAQSNVAVKNIAEKFFKHEFYDFRLIVSKDFHFDWHEHLYEKLEPRLIRSDKFPKSIVEASRLLLDCKIILCTLSMFSNPHIDVFLRIVPVQTIILDEASQIECGDFLPVFHRFHLTLSKLVFIGDNKQLPPYGQEDIPELRSVFEFPHLQARAVFLNTQYRMPHVIGRFISQKVYGGKLKTQHESKALEACRFVDVNKGREVKTGSSWRNFEEARVVVKLARLYESKKMSFRIITPYDAQRSHIEERLKSEGLDNKDKVFNVDSFQGLS